MREPARPARRADYADVVKTILADGAWHKPAEFFAALGVDRRSATLFRALRPLVDAGEVEARGFTRSREYRLRRG